MANSSRSSASRRSVSSCSAETACWCIVLSNTSYRALPRCFARYMARSASRITSSGRSYSGELIAIPMLADDATSCPEILQGCCSVLTIREATVLANPRSLTSSNRIVNSSPPSRATMSPGRTQASSRRAVMLSNRSPLLCPIPSLTTLRRSMSTNSTAYALSWSRPARPMARWTISVKKVRFGSPVSPS